MPTYLTIRDLRIMFQKNERTIRKWVYERREIRLDGQLFVPEKDPGGHWRFVVRRLP